MSVKHSLLALLAEGPTHGYQLKTAFEQRTGGAWLLNVGQVYTTLHRLERDGLIEDDGAPGEGEGERTTYRLTPAGAALVEQWYESPVVTDGPPRDELATKVLIAVAAEHVDITALLQHQRTAAVSQLQEYTRQKAHTDPDRELPWLLLLDALILRTESEIRWLDLCEARLRARDTDPTAPTRQGGRR